MGYSTNDTFHFILFSILTAFYYCTIQIDAGVGQIPMETPQWDGRAQGRVLGCVKGAVWGNSTPTRLNSPRVIPHCRLSGGLSYFGRGLFPSIPCTISFDRTHLFLFYVFLLCHTRNSGMRERAPRVRIRI